MKATKTAMREEALARIKMLELDESVIERFQKDGSVTVSDQQFVDFDAESAGSSELIQSFPNFVSVNGRMYQIFSAAPSKKRIQLIEELEESDDVLVYHILRAERSHDKDNDNNAVYVFLTVWGDDDDWEVERQSITEFSIAYGYQTTLGCPQTIDYLEYGGVPITPCIGCLVITNMY